MNKEEIKPMSRFAKDFFCGTVNESFNTRIKIEDDGELIFLEDKPQSKKDEILRFYEGCKAVNTN